MEIEKATLYRAGKLDDIFVFQANYQSFQFCKHSHEDFALGLMFQGTQKLHCRGQCYYAEAGSLITVNADEVHDGMSADGQVYQYKIIYIPENLLQKIGSGKEFRKRKHRFYQPVTRDNELALQLRTLFCGIDDNDSDQLEIQSSFSSLLATLLFRHGSGDAFSFDDRQIPEAIDRACTFINDMARNDITLEDIAAVAGLSRYYFLRLFHASCGITPHSYLLQCRLQLARESLKAGRSIADVAIDAGFSDQSHFTRRFKSAFGITPRQYQKAIS